LAVPVVGSLGATGDPWQPFQLLDRDGAVVDPVSAYLRDLGATGRPATTQRSYAMDLLRWYRFVWALDVPWDQATREEARDFCLWLGVAEKPRRPHWRHGDAAASLPARPAGAMRNGLTTKSTPSTTYAASTRAHCETVVRSFYDFHLEMGTGPMVNPFPLTRRSRRHRNPMEPPRAERTGRYRPKVPTRRPRAIPDERFSELFAALATHRDRALVALWVSSGARASELLGLTCGDVDPGQQTITVIRKGSGALQLLPASADAFVWLRLYEAETQGLVPRGPDEPVWWTLRRPWRRLTYDAARAMFARANATLGAKWTLHDLRHTAATRMAADPALSLTDVQWVLGHARLATTQRYLNPLAQDVITSVLAYHARRGDRSVENPSPLTTYRAESLDVLFSNKSQ
jgi:integrase